VTGSAPTGAGGPRRSGTALYPPVVEPNAAQGAFQIPPPQPQVDFSDEHREALARAFVEAQLAVLAAVARDAQRTDTYDGPRNVTRLTQALSMLRTTAGGGLPSGYYAGPPLFMDPDDETV
jgi:hypothetical protein